MTNKTQPEYKNIGTYLKEDHHSNTKESFKQLAAIIGESLNPEEEASILDVGCATGAWLSYISQQYPKLRCTGIDIFDELLTNAQNALPSAQFTHCSATDIASQFNKEFDISTGLGLLGIFDEEDAKAVLDGMIAATKKGGKVYFLSPFNDYHVDMIIKHRKYTDKNDNTDWEKGWNIYSKSTLENWLEGKVSQFRFIDFKMPFDLEPKEDPIRTWTIPNSDGSRQLTNGLKLLVDLSFLEITI